jgi:hypothetical protein
MGTILEGSWVVRTTLTSVVVIGFDGISAIAP